LTGDTDHERFPVLRRAVAAYRVPVADGCDLEWVETSREGDRRIRGFSLCEHA
jgi:hypothetical protein